MTVVFPAMPPLPSISPLLRTLALSDDEQRLVAALQQKMSLDRSTLLLRDAYYNGEQILTDLGIAIPPELQGLHTVVGWPRLAVDALHERMDVEGFRLSSSDDADTSLWGIWQANNLDEESPLAHLDALIFGRAYVLVGTGDDADLPLITVESPLNMAGTWDARRRRVSAALQTYSTDDGGEAALYLPDETITLRQAENANRWDVVERDRHRLGFIPVLRMANRQRAHDRSGWSEITTEIMSLTDAACRTLLGLEVAREFYGAPQRYILGVAEEAFQDTAGNPVDKWQTYLGRVLALERDEDGNVPEVGQFTPYNPAVYREIVNLYAEQMSPLTALPPSYLGQVTDNPASADAIRMSTDRLIKRVRRRETTYSGTWEAAVRLAARFRGQAIAPDTVIETIWANPEIPTPAATTDAVAKQIEAGYLPATSDVAGELLGYSPVQRRRIDAERQRAQGEQALSALLGQAQGATQQNQQVVTGADTGQPASG